MDTNQQQDDGDEHRAGDLLVGGDNIETFLISLGFENADPYYLKKRGWPIGKTGVAKSAQLIASKRRLIRYSQKIATPQNAA